MIKTIHIFIEKSFVLISIKSKNNFKARKTYIFKFVHLLANIYKPIPLITACFNWFFKSCFEPTSLTFVFFISNLISNQLSGSRLIGTDKVDREFAAHNVDLRLMT